MKDFYKDAKSFLPWFHFFPQSLLVKQEGRKKEREKRKEIRKKKEREE